MTKRGLKRQQTPAKTKLYVNEFPSFLSKAIVSFSCIFNDLRYYYRLQRKTPNCNTLYKIAMHYSASFIEASRVVGLTGGIGTGKTTASNYLINRYGLTILDADLYAREAVSKGSKGLRAMVARYGSEILQPDDSLNRSRLAHIMFQNPLEKQWIESMIHPYVRHRLEGMRELLAQKSTIVMVIPLLFEARMTDLVSEVWVVFCRPEQQLNRLMQRNQLTMQDAQLRIHSQMPMTEKCARADVVLDNSGSEMALYAQIDRALVGHLP